MTEVDLDQLAASLRAGSADTGTFVEGLARKLEDMLPGRVSVQRGRRGLFGPKEVRKIAVDAGAQRLELQRGEAERVETRCARVSAGIVLKSEELDIDEWLRELSAAITAEAQRSEQTRQALERVLLD